MPHKRGPSPKGFKMLNLIIPVVTFAVGFVLGAADLEELENEFNDLFEIDEVEEA